MILAGNWTATGNCSNMIHIEHWLNLLLDDFTAPSSLHAGAARAVKRNFEDRFKNG